MSGGTRLMLSLLGVTASEDGEAVSEPELRMMLLNAKQSGAVELYEKDMIEGVLDLDQATVEQIMQPRVEVVGIEVGDSLRGGSDPPRRPARNLADVQVLARPRLQRHHRPGGEGWPAGQPLARPSASAQAPPAAAGGRRGPHPRADRLRRPAGRRPEHAARLVSDGGHRLCTRDHVG